MDAYLSSYVDSVMDLQETHNGIFRPSFFTRLFRFLSGQ
ncbi:MAG: hypothetical protein MG2_0475 [uncultured Candidatus Poseidoniales archaeon]|nr:MAG: hypothetical protein MG2_0475 [uncultured Candidatus Poseidoniales archaeon]